MRSHFIRALALLFLFAGPASGIAFILTSDINPSTAGQTITLTASFVPSATNVSFLDNGSPIGVSNSGNSNSATFQTSSLSAGTHPLTACYNNPGGGQTCTSNTLNQVVNAPSSPTLTSDINPSLVGQTITLTASPVPSATSVTFSDGGTVLGSSSSGNSNSASLSTSTLAQGTHQLVACYTLSPSPPVCSNTLTQVVNTPPTPTLTSNPNPSVVGQAVTLTASPVPSATTVNFRDGGNIIGQSSSGASNFATIQISTLALGTHQLVACYDFPSDTTFCSNPIFQVVNPAANLTLSSSPNPSSAGQTITLTATPVPPGTFATFYDGGPNGTVIGSGQSSSGPVTIQVSNLTAGTHQLVACYNSATSAICSNTVSQVVNQGSSSLTLTSSVNPSGPCQPVTFTATVLPSGATGTVGFFDGTATLATVPLVNGSASTTVSNFTLGTHQIQSRYFPDPGFSGASNLLVQTVMGTPTVTLSSTPNPSNLGQTVTISAAVSGTACPGLSNPPQPAGSVQFFDGSTPLGLSNLASGVATFSTSNLAVGSHPLSAQYLGDPNYSPYTSNTVTQIVNAINRTATTTVLTTSANPITVGQPVTLTATVAPSGATGQVQFQDGTIVIGTSTLTGGIARLTVPGLTAGVHLLTAVYLGDNTFNLSVSNTINETVGTTANTTTTLTTSANPISLNQPLILTAVVAPSGATGQVQFKDGGSVIGTSTLTGGVAIFTASNLTAGIHPLTATYLGDPNFNPSTSNTVNEAVTGVSSTTLSVSPNPATIGQPVTLSASVGPLTATGSVQFFDGATSLGQGNLTNGSATLQVSTFTAGSHTLTARYLGDSINLSSTSPPVILTVNRIPTVTILTASLNPATFSQPITLTAAVAPFGATGQVQFLDGGSVLATITLSNGLASITISTLALGSHSLTAAYLGDTNFSPSTSPPVGVTVVQPINPTTSTTLSVSPNPADVGQAVTLRAVVTPATATGTVTFNDNGVAIGNVQLTNGVAAFLANGLAAGSHTIVAVYGGDATFGSSSSPPVTLQINGVQTRTTLVVSPNPATFGQTVFLNATVTALSGTGIPSGTLTFSDGNTALAQVLLNGANASFQTSTLPVGTHILTASYSGDNAFNPSSSPPVSLDVTKAPTATALTAAPLSSDPGQAVKLTAKVTSTATAPITGTVTFMDGTVAIGAPIPLVDGSASITTSSLTNGSHSLTAVYSGDTNFLGSTSPPVNESVGVTSTTTTLTVTPASSSFGQMVTLTATVVPSGATGSVTFLDANRALGSGTLSDGTATFSTSTLSPGAHSLSARYEGDNKFGASTSPAVTETVAGKGDSTTVLTVAPNPSPLGQPVTLRAVVTPSSATGSVTFLDGGTSLGSGPLTGGIAIFTTTSLLVGAHILTASYPGEANLNGSTSAPVTEVVNVTNPLGNISPVAMLVAIVGVPFSQQFSVTGGTAPLSWSLASESAPGLTLSPGGLLSGTPTTAGTTSLTVRVQDNVGLATAAVVGLTVLPVPSVSISSPPIISTADQPIPQVTLSQPYTLPLNATFSLSFVPNASNLPANYTNPDVKFIGGGTTSGPIPIPANSIGPVLLPAVQVGTVAGTITVTLASLMTSTGQSVLPANPPTTTITVARLAPTIVPGSVKIINITATGFSVFLDGISTPRDLTSASLTFTAAPGATLNGAQATVSLTAASAAWFPDTGANRGVANGGAFSLTMPFAYSGDPAAIGTVSVTVTNSAGTSPAQSGGR